MAQRALGRGATASRGAVARAIAGGLAGGRAAAGIAVRLWAVDLLLAVPASLAVFSALREGIGPSLDADRLAAGFDMAWYGAFAHGARGIAATFRPSLVGPGPILDDLEGWLSGELFARPPALVALGVVFALVWTLLLGGALSRLARPWRGRDLAGLVADGARCFPAFALFTGLAGVGAWGVYAGGRLLFPWIEDATRDVTSERWVLAAYLAGAGLVAAALMALDAAADYARIAVALDGRGALAAAGEGARFVLAHPLRCGAVYAALGGLSLLLQLGWAAVAPGVGPGSALGVLATFGAAQVYLMLKIGLRLALLAGELALWAQLRR